MAKTMIIILLAALGTTRAAQISPARGDRSGNHQSSASHSSNPHVSIHHASTSHSSASISVTVTVDWLFEDSAIESATSTSGLHSISATRTDNDYDMPKTTQTPTSSWIGWGPSSAYYPPPDLTTSSIIKTITDSGACPPTKSNSKKTGAKPASPIWKCKPRTSYLSKTPKVTLFTTYPVTITRLTTEAYATVTAFPEGMSTCSHKGHKFPCWPAVVRALRDDAVSEEDVDIKTHELTTNGGAGVGVAVGVLIAGLIVAFL